MYSLSEIDAVVERGIINTGFKGEPSELYEPIEYLISIGGKRLRPKLAVLTFNLFSEKVDQSIIYPALALEIFHGFTLIHDDIMDNASMRRGQMTVHKKWDTNTAILSGDVMCIKAYELLSYAPANSLPAVFRLFTKTATQVCEGQQYDMNFEEMPFITMGDYIDMIALKTAVLMACSAKMGALIAGASEKQSQALYDFAYNLGLAFQITDDYLDTFGDSNTFGKSIGGDIVNNKKTWLLVDALKRADSASQAEIRRLMEIKEDNASEKIFGFIDLYKRLGTDEAAQEAIRGYHKNAFDCLANRDFTKEQLARLESFSDSLLNRNK